MSALVQDIKSILSLARQQTYQTINTNMIKTYWLVGQRIVEEEQEGKEQAAYGKQLLQNLSKALSQELGKGFSYANLRNFRQFYLTYQDWENCYTLCSRLTWSHNRLIMRISDDKARRYYLQEAASNQWSVRQTEKHIHSKHYERLLSTGQTELSPTESENKYDIIKDPYVFDFLQIPSASNTKENVLERLLINDLEKFLLELGKGFSFVGRQYRISTETTHYFIDLVFYNYILKCFVLLDLKVNKLNHQDLGQMDMYIRLFDELKKGTDDNPTIGIILCADKDETMVKYSMLNEHQQLFASKYITYLPTEEELIREIEYVKQLNQKNNE